MMKARGDRLKGWQFLMIGAMQAFLLLAHGFVLFTVIAFWPGLAPAAVARLHEAMPLLAFSFAPASLLAMRFANPAVRVIYWLASLWLGLFNYLFCLSPLAWAAWFALRLADRSLQPHVVRPLIDACFFALAALVVLWGMWNGRAVRTRRITVALPGLPASWKGRRAVLVSDLHLGPINGVRFCRRIAARVAAFQPDIVFVPGDLFDGTKGDLDCLAAPLKALRPPLGMFFSTGNHEEFGDPTPYLEAARGAGMRVLAGQAVAVDGMQIAGVSFHSSTSPLGMKTALDAMQLDPSRPSILLNHAPAHLAAVEQAGFSLQLSGHTHGGQFLPFTWITKRIYGRFTSGLERLGSLQVCTSTGAGSWGPPMRIGTQPELIVLTFASCA